ncbi:MAG TPA: efflux RND transporter permease subunit [Candidatus Krumholzibacteria bacterium]|nr:efflux RND transporter permease subunit [Candidatus Krumholzibacteria bacterium]HPD72295.1 efflux RND transporter permease subunit [Candidatus Krumholzibacteria bacterium]HRY40773.1 efflux RND transporter permease subunit [Candidatus Krumholzibacteria bacterium]
MIGQAVRRPVAVLMIFAGLVILGWQGQRRLALDFLPAINYPNLTVITNYADTPADDLVRLVTEPLEEVIAGQEGVRRIVSRTREGVSTITVQYDWGTDMDFANLHLREAVDQVAYRDDFPVVADRPLILRWDPSARPIAILVLEGDGPLREMTDFAREVVKPAMEQIEGISQAEVIGGAEREILVQPDFERLRLYGLTVDDLVTALRVSNVNFPGGRIRRGPLYLPLRILGEFENLDEIRSTEIPAAGPGITLADVADVVDTTQEPEGLTYLGADEVVALHLYKEVGKNTIDATREVDDILGVLKDQYPDFNASFVYRDADYVAQSVAGLQESLLYGALLAFGVLFIFLADWRTPIVVGVAIPVSIMTTFALLDFGKVNLNLMSLGGLSLAAGMLVDNSIVVLENITRRLEERRGKASPESMAALCTDATREVASPVFASTLTTIAVFFPVIYVPGIAGELFRDQALTVTFSLLVSILAALILQPMLSAYVLRPVGRPGWLFRPGLALADWSRDAYHRRLPWVLDHKAVFLSVIVVLLVVTAWLGAGMRKTFLPDRNQGDFSVHLELPAGTPVEATGAIASELAAFVQAQPRVATVYTQVGQTEKTLASLKEYTAPNVARIRVLLEPSRHGRHDMTVVKDALEARLARLAGAVWTYRDEGIGLSEVLASGEAPFTLGVVSEDPEDARRVAEELLANLAGVPGLSGLEMDRVLGNPILRLSLDRERALRFGIEPEFVAGELRGRIRGTVATQFNEIDRRIDIAVRLPRDQRQNLDEVLASPIALPGGKTVNLGAFVTQQVERPVREIVRRDQRRQITISGDVLGRAVDEVWRDVQPILAAVERPAGLAFVGGGEQEEIHRSFRDLAWALVLSALLIYMILAAQFESFVDPLIIAAVLPVGVMGAVLTLLAVGETLNIISIIGLISLLGIAVNDAIVKVATIRRMREEDGLSVRQAILDAGHLRYRPIVMNTLTTVIGLAPTAIGLGTGEQMQRPLALVIIGGLVLATVLTLYLTPCIYELVHAGAERRAARKAGQA